MKPSRVVMYNKNRPILALEMKGNEVTEIVQVLNEKYMPLLFKNGVTVKSLNLWISKRLISEKREGLDVARTEFPRFENHDCMFSLSDQYWFKRRNSDSWSKLNFFTNPYTEDVGKIFFTPWDVNPSEVGLPSPDLQTNGVLKKAWRKENGVDYLYKAASKVYHQQPISEVLASLFLKNLDFIPFVEYELDIYGLELCSRCSNFVDENSEFVPASHIFYLEPLVEGETIYNHFLKMCEKLNIKGVKRYLDKMIAADKIIGNDDRHLGNFGFLRNVETGEIYDFAPLFDSGSSFYGIHDDGGKKAKMFERESYDALKNVMREYDLGKAYDHTQMFNLIDKHPDIPKEKKIEMKRRISLTSKDLKILSKRILDELEKESEEEVVDEAPFETTPVLKTNVNA